MPAAAAAVRYAYSLNGENYTGAFGTRDQALAAAIAAARNAAGDPMNNMGPQTVFVAKRVEADPHTTGHARTVLREMAWQAHDEVGARATSYLHQLDDQRIKDLDRSIERVLNEWLAKHDLLPTYFRVAAISEHPIPPAGDDHNEAEPREVNQTGDNGKH